ncbi:phage tail tube protein [Leuconostoc fallax]|uniref:Uncharacterized protein n=1 Tax=Leuconostoc fallax TaxID=1251 RepID=A0A4R5N823_9LACO|nr:phage tail tube protein [Leuconostoc fallax]TDG68073.1 hypothetical protein C5L23_000379 [Leuconostoc fallax]
MRDVLSGKDVINSKSGMVTVNIDGQNIELIELTEFTAQIDKNKEDVQVIGSLWTKKKTTSIAGSGSMGGKVINSNWAKLGQKMANEGVDTFFDATVVVEDETSSVGKQTVAFHNINMDSIPLVALEADDGVMEWESDFSFEGFNLVSAFNGI